MCVFKRLSPKVVILIFILHVFSTLQIYHFGSNLLIMSICFAIKGEALNFYDIVGYIINEPTSELIITLLLWERSNTRN